MNIREKLKAVKAEYKKLAKYGVGDPLALKSEAQKLLEEAKSEGFLDVDELEEILIDLSFLAEETKCKCQNTKCRC